MHEIAEGRGEGRGETSPLARLEMAALRAFMVKRYLARLARTAPVERLVATLRRIDARPPAPGAHRDWRVECDDIAGLTCRTFRPLADDPHAVPPVVLLHSGGYVAGPVLGEWHFAGELCRLTGRTIVMPLYPRAPEASWRDGQAALIAFYRAATERGGGRPVDVVGLSAGGGLAVVLALRAAAEAMTPPARLVLVSPWLDLALSGPGITDCDARDPMLSAELMHCLARIHAGDDDPGHAYLSPVNAPLAALPPTAVFHTTSDVLYAGSAEFVLRAAAAGVAVADHVRHGLPHCHVLARFLPEARRDRAAIAKILRGNAAAATVDRSDRPSGDSASAVASRPHRGR